MLLWFILAAIGVAGVVMWLKSSKSLPVSEARAYLANGAWLVDVRSPAEFSSGHLRNAKNLPLDQIETLATTALKDKNQVLLLHCQSGMRSRVAQRKLQQLGYAHAFNVGSYAQASQIVN